MMSRVARFDELEGSDGGLPDSQYPSAVRTLYNVIGFQPPETDVDNEAATSPVGDDAARLAAIPISEGFNLGYCRAEPGKGPMMHNHDTNETFISMSGTWRAAWLNEEGEEEFADLAPLDVISFPAGVIRRFENVSFDDPDGDHVLMFVIGGNGPAAEFTDESMATLSAAGLVT